jgi:hypothetical protein
MYYCIVSVQGLSKRQQRLHRVLLHEEVFRPLDPTDSLYRQDTASVMKSDVCWATRHIILRWLVDTAQHTVRHPGSQSPP